MTDPATRVVAIASPGTFEEFFEREYERLSRAMFLLTTDHARAEDLAQEAMARACERWDRIGSMAAPTSYVFRIAINLHRRQSRHGKEASATVDAPAPADPASLVADRDQIIRALGHVSVPQREALLLVGWLGYDAESAGEILGIDAASVRGRVHRARATLQTWLGGSDG
jgi:RNA polymerase sigma factor (sigma-70 family)